MDHVIFAVLVGISVYLAIIALIPRQFKGSTAYTRGMMQQLEKAKLFTDPSDDNISVLRDHGKELSLMARIFMALPRADRAYPYLLKAGMANRIGRFFSVCLVIFFLAAYALKSMGPLVAIIGGAVVSFLLGWRHIKKQILKRNDLFLQYFPDALDMLVRSVRSGYPISSAIRMVSENSHAPVSTEFKQVADEVSYGSTLIEALQRLAIRVNEPDVHFFVVVLSVQSDIGGSLAEVLGNLSSIIRKRKHLRLKVKALSSEGRATAWVLGSMPVAEALLIEFVSPDYLTPLFTTPTGNTLLIITLCTVSVGVFIVKQMVNIKV